MVVELHHFAKSQRVSRPHVLESCSVDNHGIWPLQVFDGAQNQMRNDARKRRIVDAEQNDLLQQPVGRMRNSQALVKRNGPVDAIYAAHPLELSVGHRFNLIDIFDAWIHDPNVGLPGVEDLARGAAKTLAGGALSRRLSVRLGFVAVWVAMTLPPRMRQDWKAGRTRIFHID